MGPRVPTCIICGAALSPRQAHQGAVCDQASCARAHRARPAHQRCAVCGRGLAAREAARGACADAACQKAWLIDRPIAERQEQRRALIARATAWRDEEAAARALPDPAAFVATPTPCNTARVVPLPAERRDALREHLTQKASQALQGWDESAAGRPPRAGEMPTSAWTTLPAPSAAMQDALSVACATCRGSCCLSAENHAYVSVGTIRAYLAGHPGKSRDQIVDAYMSHVAPETMHTGCVYQVEQGCTLPRAMRSDTCNQYFCESLIELQRRHADDVPLRVFVAADNRGHFERGAFVEPEVVTAIRRRDRDA